MRLAILMGDVGMIAAGQNQEGKVVALLYTFPTKMLWNA